MIASIFFLLYPERKNEFELMVFSYSSHVSLPPLRLSQLWKADINRKKNASNKVFFATIMTKHLERILERTTAPSVIFHRKSEKQVHNQNVTILMRNVQQKSTDTSNSNSIGSNRKLFVS
jgi:hypothetical protein